MYNGILVFSKPQGFTSHDAVAKLRGILRQRRIGHAGTLDPMATGVLVVLLGSATKASEDASGADKTYIAGLRPGVVTDTQDIWGNTVSQAPCSLPAERLESALAAFRGEVKQVPPMYSAVQIGGKRLYSMARKGIEVPRPARQIFVSCLEMLPGGAEGEFLFKITCSKGTYVRTLCHDIGQHLGCGACMTSLVRVASGSFGIEDALDFDTVEALHKSGRLEKHILPVDRLYAHLPQVRLTPEGERRAQNGNRLHKSHLSGGEIPPEGEKCRVYVGDALYMTGVSVAEGNGPAIACDKTFGTATNTRGCRQ